MDPGFEPPPYAIIERDESGTPTGTVRETAMGHLKSFAPKTSREAYLDAARFVQKIFNGAGGHRSPHGGRHSGGL